MRRARIRAWKTWGRRSARGDRRFGQRGVRCGGSRARDGWRRPSDRGGSWASSWRRRCSIMGGGHARATDARGRTSDVGASTGREAREGAPEHPCSPAKTAPSWARRDRARRWRTGPVPRTCGGMELTLTSQPIARVPRWVTGDAWPALHDARRLRKQECGCARSGRAAQDPAGG